MNEPLIALAVWLADFFLLATVLLAVAVLAALRIRQPAQRMALAWATMAGLTALLAATAAPSWPRWDLRQSWTAIPADDGAALEKPIITYHERTFAFADDSQTPPIEALSAPATLPAVPASPMGERIDGPAAMALAWLVCAAAALGWIALGAVQAGRLLWTAAPSPPWARTDLARLVGRRWKPRLKTSTKIGSAVALGALRPAILLPAEHVREDNRPAVDAALAHEWAHIRHGDLWLLAWQRLLLPLLAVHPLFWLLRRQIRADQELLADIVAAGDRPAEYAEALLAWAKSSGSQPRAGLAALAMWEDPHTVSRRIQMILDPKNPAARQKSRLGRWTIVAALSAIVGCLSVISFRSPTVAAQEDKAQLQDRQIIDSAAPIPPTAQVQQVELSVAMIRLGNEGEDITAESLRELGQPFGDNDNFVFDNGVCVVALPREQVATAIKLLRESGDAKILSQPKLMTLSGRDAYVADGGELPSIRETDFADGRRIEQIEFKSRRSLRIRPEIRTQSATRPTESKAASIVRLSVTREDIEPIDELDPDSETEKTRPKMITRQLRFTADVPIGRTLLIWELKHVAEDEANLVLITPEGIHRVTREVLASPRPLALDFAFPTTQPTPATPEVLIFPNDKEAVKQIRAAMENLRAEAANNSQLREEMQKQTARLQKQISELTTQLKWLWSVSQPEARQQVSDEQFIRRVYLDLLGVLPSPDDAKLFVDSRDDNKREKLIARLLEDPKVADYWTQTWRNLLVAGDPAAKTSLKTPLPPPTESKLVRAFTLQNLPAERAVELFKELFPPDDKSPSRAVDDPRTNSIVVQGRPQEIETFAAILRVMDRPAEQPDRNRLEAKSSESAPSLSGHDLKTQRKLLEIDLQQAEAEMELAAAELEGTKKLGAAVSTSELRKQEAALRHAALKRERAKVLLEAVTEKEKSAARSPLNAVEEALLPPKNLPERIWETLGLKLEPIDEDAFAGLKSAFRGGLMVNDVRPGSPADERGLRQGDILVGLGRWETRSLDNVAYVLAQDDASEAGELSFHVLRDGEARVGRLSIGPGEIRQAAAPHAAGPSRRLATEVRLAEIDLREAQLELQGLSKEYSRIAGLAEQGTVQQAEKDRILLKKQQAELAVERAQIVLEGLKSQTANPPRK